MKIDQLNARKIGSILSIKRERERIKTLKFLKPCTLSTFACLSDAGFFIVSKISLDGMSRYVLVVYAHAIDDLVTAVLAILFERFFLLTIILVINYFFNKILFLFITRKFVL